MARKRAAAEAPPADPGQELPELDEIDLAQKKLSEWRGNFDGDGYFIRVERWQEALRSWAFIDTLPFDGWDLISLRRFVEGPLSRFRLTLLDNEKAYVKGGRFEQPVLNPDYKDPGSAPTPPPAPAAPEDPLKNPLVQMMIENNKAQQTQLLELLKVVAGKPAGPDPLEMFLKIRNLLPEQKAPGLKEQTETLIALKELLDVGDGERGDSWISELKEGFNLFQQITDLAAKKRANRLPGAPAGAIPAAPRLSNPPTKEPAAVSNPILDKVRPYVPIFLAKAKAGADPADAAALLCAAIDNDIMPAVLDTYPVSEDLAYGQLIEGAKDPAKVEQIYQFAPELGAYRDWVAKVVLKAIELYETDAQPEGPGPAYAA